MLITNAFCIAEMEKYQKLAEAARKKKRDKLVRQKHAKPPVKPIPDQDELEKAKAAVQKRERALKAAKTKEQKAQQDLRRKQLLEKKRALASEPDADEGACMPQSCHCVAFSLCKWQSHGAECRVAHDNHAWQSW